MGYISKKQNLLDHWNIPGGYNRGTIRIKAVNCNKPTCGMCPHAYYAYYRKTECGQTKETYLGRCDKDGQRTETLRNRNLAKPHFDKI